MTSTPTRFGNYILLDRINVGGMAEVFRAKSCDVAGFDRLIAVKRILASISSSREFVDMFVNEAKIAVRLNHANIAQIFDLGHVHDSYYIAMEYVHGRDLRAVYDRCQDQSLVMPVPVACYAMMKVCEGLEYAHNKRDEAGNPMCLVHRDVSPQNVVISYDGDVKLIDFGVAKAAGGMRKTQAGVLKGKFAYMSPEQVRGLPLDKRSDIFSVGVILFEFLSGRRLFWGETDFATLEQVRVADIPSPRSINPELDEAIEAIALRALAKDVDDRYQSAIDLHDDLQTYLYNQGLYASRKDLAGWMERRFAAEIGMEAERLASYSRLNWKSTVGALSEPLADTLTGEPDGEPRSLIEASPLPFNAVSPESNGPASAVESVMEQPQAVAEVEDTQPDSWYEDDADTQIYDATGSDDPLQHVPVPEVVVPIDPGPTTDDAPANDTASTVAAADPGQASALDIQPGVSPEQVRSPPRRRLAVLLVVTTLALSAAVAYLGFVLLHRSGSLTVESKPSGAQLYVDGRRIAGKTPMEVDKLDPGITVVSIRKRGYRTWAEAVEISAGSPTRISAVLERLPFGRIAVRTRPSGAKVIFDGRQLEGRTPLEVARVPPGRHELRLHGMKGYAPLRKDFDVRPSQQLTLSFDLSPSEVTVEVTSHPPAATILLRHGGTLKELGRSPLSVQIAPLESATLLVRRRGYKEWSTPLHFDGRPTVQIAAVLERR